MSEGISLEQKHAIEVQLVSIKCGAIHGALAFAGLITGHALAGSYAGILFAVAAAGFAYLNFSLIAAGAKGHWINLTMAASILCAVASGATMLALT